MVLDRFGLNQILLLSNLFVMSILTWIIWNKLANDSTMEVIEQKEKLTIIPKLKMMKNSVLYCLEINLLPKLKQGARILMAFTLSIQKKANTSFTTLGREQEQTRWLLQRAFRNV